MIGMNKLIEEFHKHGGVLKTSELRQLGLNSRQIKKLLDLCSKFTEENICNFLSMHRCKYLCSFKEL